MVFHIPSKPVQVSYRAKLLASHAAVALIVSGITLLIVDRVVTSRMEEQVDSRLEGHARAIPTWFDRSGHPNRLASRLAEWFDNGSNTVEGFTTDLKQRFGGEGEGRGVNLLTFHRAKGLEFDAVFLPRLEEGELPFKRSKTDEAIAEERRLLYVGITRARKHLMISWSAGSRTSPSRSLAELGIFDASAPRESKPKAGPASGSVAAEDRPAFDALKKWRLDRADRDSVPAYVVFHDATLSAIAAAQPRDLDALSGIAGIGAKKLERYGPALLALLREAA